MIGIGTSGQFTVNREGSFCGHFIFSQVIPQAIQIKDSIKAKITGFNFGFAYGGAISSRSEMVSLFFYAGFNTGRLRIYGNELIRQKNGYFSPKIGIQPKIIFNNIALSFILECDYDITNPNWKKTLFSSKDQLTMDKYRQSAVTAQVSLGYCFD
jgi:hypothetical protein